MAHLHIKFVSQSDKDFFECEAELNALATPLPNEHVGGEHSDSDAAGTSHGEHSNPNPSDSIGDRIEFIITDIQDVDADGSVIFTLPDRHIESMTVELRCGDEVLASSPIMKNADGSWPKSAVVLVEPQEPRKKCDVSCEAKKPIKHDCGLKLKEHHALKQNRYVYISKVEQPEVCTFPLYETVELNASDRNKLEKAVGHMGKMEAERIAAEQKAALDAFYTNPANFESTYQTSQVKNIPGISYAALRMGVAMPAAAVEGGQYEVTSAAEAQNHAQTMMDVDFGKATLGLADLKSPSLFIGPAQISDAIAVGAMADIAEIANTPYKDLPARYELTCKRPLHWDDAALPQSCAPFLIHVLEFVEEVIHTGYQYGKIIDTQSLLPCEDIQLASVTFRREETTSRQEKMVAVDALSASISRARDIDDLHKATVNESMRGGSSSRVGGWGVGAAIPLYGAIIGVGGGGGRSKAKSFQNSARTMTASASQRLRDSTQQASHSVRSQTVTVVNRVTQEESVSSVTRSIRNHNHSRSLDLVTYEVDRCLEVRHRLAGVREGLCVPLKMTQLTDKKIMRHREALEMAVRDRSLMPGFDAIQRKLTNYEGVNFPTGTYADALVKHLEGELEFEIRVGEPDPIAFTDPLNYPGWYRHHPRLQSFILNSWRHATANRNRLWREKVAAGIAGRLADFIQVRAVMSNGVATSLPMDATLLSRKNNRDRLKIGFKRDHTQPWPQLSRGKIEAIEIRLVDDGGTAVTTEDLFPGGTDLLVRSGHLNYKTDFAAGHLFHDRRINDDLTGSDYARVYTPLIASEMESPMETDKKYRSLLRAEINDNLPLCYEMIYTHMAIHKPSEMRMLMDRVLIPGTGGLSMRTLMGDFIGAFDGCVAFFVAPGYELSAERVNDLLKEHIGEDGELDLMELYDPKIPVDPTQILLPTGATFTEASLGRCNLAETIDHSLNVNWGEPCGNNATAINPINMDSRRAEPADVTPTDFANPIINIQNAPAAPNYDGVGGILGAIGSSDMFRDMAGLDQTQKNALAAFQKSMDVAQSSQNNALEMWKMDKSVRDMDKLKSRLGKMVEDETLTGDEAKGFMKEYLKNITNPNINSIGLGGAGSNTVSGSSIGTGDGDGGTAPSNSPQGIYKGLKGDDAVGGEFSYETPDSSVTYKPSEQKYWPEATGYGLSAAGPNDFMNNLLKSDGFLTEDLTPLQTGSNNEIGLAGLGVGSEEVEIVLRSFIPSEILYFGYQAFGGDNRSFDYTSNDFRGEIISKVTFGSNHPSPSISTLAAWGETTKYNTSDTEQVVGKPGWFYKKKSGATSIDSKTLQLADSTMTGDVKYNYLTSPLGTKIDSVPRNAQATLTMAGNNPLVWGSPSIDAKINVYLKTFKGRLHYRLIGYHDGFPAYELFINGKLVKSFDPVKAKETPWSLAGSGEHPVLTKWLPLD